MIENQKQLMHRITDLAVKIQAMAEFLHDPKNKPDSDESTDGFIEIIKRVHGNRGSSGEFTLSDFRLVYVGVLQRAIETIEGKTNG